MDKYRKFGITDLLMLIAVVVWAVNFSFVKIALREFAPLAFNGLRLLFASLFLLIFLLLRGEGISIPKGNFWKMVGLGIVGNTIYQLLFIQGINVTTASNTSVVMAMSPIFVALLSTFLKQEKISRTGWAGILLSFLGFYLVIAQQNGMLGFSWSRAKGDMMIFTGNLCWAYYTVQAKPLLEKMSPLKFMSITMAAGALFFLPFSLRDFLSTPWDSLSFQAWAILLFSAFFALTLCYIVWYTSVKRVGNSRTAVYGNITPVFTVFFAYFFLSERMSPMQAAGALIILGGVYLTRFGYRFFKGVEKRNY